MRLTRIRFLAAMLGAFGLAAIAVAAHATPYLDQSNSVVPTFNFSAVRAGFSVAQTFTAGFSGTLVEVDVIVDPRGNPAANLVLEIQATTGGAANGTVLASATVPPFAGPNPTVEFDVSGASLSVTAGTVYAYVLKTNAALGNDYLARAVPSNTYSRGQFTDGGGFAPGGGWDMIFKTWVEPASLPGAGTSDQVNHPTPTGNFAAIANGLTATQTFTVGRNGMLTRIDVTIDPRNSPVLDLVMDVYATNGGVPTGAPLASTSLEPFGGSNPTVTFDISPYNLSVTQGSVLAFTLRSYAAGGTDYLARAVPGNTYAGGQFTNSSGGFASGAGWDAIFETFVYGGGPAGSNDVESSMGQFRIVVDSRFWPMMTGYPGFALKNGLHRLLSPVMIDPATIVGRSVQIAQGDALDTGGVPVGTAGTIVSDGSIAAFPPGFDGVAGTPEIHTELRRLNLVAKNGSGVAVRAGTMAPSRPLSVGEMQGPSGGASLFPAHSFFDVFAEVDLPLLGGNPTTTTLRNTLPLIVEATALSSLPPKVVYFHRHTGPVPVVFRDNDTHVPMRWVAGERFGMLVLAGHGFRYDTLSAVAARSGAATRSTLGDEDDFQQLVDAEPELADSTTLNTDALDVVTFTAASEFVDPAYRDSLLDGMDAAADANGSGGPCDAIPIVARLIQRVDGSATPPDWMVAGAARDLMFDRLHALAEELQIQANDLGGCAPLATGPESRASGLGIRFIHPNPTAGSAVIEYVLPQRGDVRLEVYDLSGRLTRTLVSGEQAAGVHTTTWDGSQDRGGAARGGVYFVRLASGGLHDMRRIARLE